MLETVCASNVAITKLAESTKVGKVVSETSLNIHGIPSDRCNINAMVLLISPIDVSYTQVSAFHSAAGLDMHDDTSGGEDDYTLMQALTHHLRAE